MMQLTQNHVDALDHAEKLLFHFDFCPYFELKALLLDPSPLARERFRFLFKRFYALNTGGVTPKFLDRYFEILFKEKAIVNGRPDFFRILNELYEFKRRKGDQALQLSFVSKLVAMQDDSSPIYDKHVVGFFRENVPATSVQIKERIDWFVNFLDDVGRSYIAWANDPRLIPVLDRLKERDKQFLNCHTVRLVDFLVWKVGNAKLLNGKRVVDNVE